MNQTCVIHGLSGTDGHSAVLGAVDGQPNEIRKALVAYYSQYGRAPMNRQSFNEFVSSQKLKLVPVVAINFELV